MTTEHLDPSGPAASSDRAAPRHRRGLDRLLVDTGEARRRRVHVCVKDAAEQALPTEAYLGVIWPAYRRHGFDEHGLSLALGGER